MLRYTKTEDTTQKYKPSDHVTIGTENPVYGAENPYVLQLVQ